MNSREVPMHFFLSFRRKPESRSFKRLSIFWTPVFTGVTILYEAVKIQSLCILEFRNWNFHL
jgi:hypothetical protein